MNQKIIITLIAVFSFAFMFVWPVFSSPSNFPVNALVKIEDGLTLSQIGERLEENGVIGSNTIFVLLARMMGKESNIKFGDYFFEKPISIFSLIRRLVSADFGIDPIKVTIFEGTASKDIAKKFKNFKNFDEKEFVELTRDMEGYLFPDTYFFLPGVSARQVARTMRINFDGKIKTLSDKIEQSDRDFSEILTMASLIEKEIAHREGRRIVSGILWKRIKVGMPLQVDAVFHYIKGENNGRVTFSDLKIDSPYNTYLNKGLPPGPISNPGLDSIEAALEPKDSPYWFYLTGKDGITRFSKDFEEHKMNRVKYLK